MTKGGGNTRLASGERKGRREVELLTTSPKRETMNLTGRQIRR